MDLALLPGQIRTVLDGHVAVLETKLSKMVGELQERLLRQTAADLGAIREQIGLLRPAAHLAQEFPGTASLNECTDAEPHQELERAAVIPVRSPPVNSRAPVLVVEDIVCENKVAETQRGALAVWTESLEDLLSNAPVCPHDDVLERLHLSPRRQGPSQARGAASACRPRAETCFDEGAKEWASEVGMVISSASSQTLDASVDAHSVGTAEGMQELKSMYQQSVLIMKAHSFYGKSDGPLSPLEKTKVSVEVVATAVILANIVWMATATELNMGHAIAGEREPAYFFWIDLGFVIAMCVEVAVKVALYRKDYFFGPHHRWNVFDVLLIGLATADLLFSAANLSFIRVLRGLRAIRATRVIRTVTIVPSLRLITASVSASLVTLFWAFVLLFLVLFLCALGVQQTVQSTIEQRGLQNQHEDLLEYYGSLLDTMLSLFKAVSGGADWQDLVAPLAHISKVYTFAYIVFIIVVVFGLLNILTAVFVEKTSNIADVDPDLVISESVQGEMSAVRALMEILGGTGADRSETITQEEFDAKLDDPRFRAQMQMLDLGILEAEGVFKMLDDASQGALTVEDLVYGLMRMKGNARAMDVNIMLCDNKRLLAKLTSFSRAVESNFKELRAAMGTTAQHSHRVSLSSAQ